MIKNIFLLCMSIVFGVSAQEVIPTPYSMKFNDGVFILENECVINVDVSACEFLEVLTQKIHHVKWIKKTDKNKGISFVTDKKLGKEEYQLKVMATKIQITASENSGFVYAIQTLRQLISLQDGKFTIPCVEISDSPRVGWRSFMLDSGRQYHRVSTIKKYIDMASELKMNYFHWHLTEGLGWRIEISAYPNLTIKGANVGSLPEQKGFYSKAEICELVKYASARAITIVPEIDMPGHAEAALTAYPEFSCFGGPIKIPTTGFTQNIFCVGKPRTIEFLKTVLDEICEMFPSEYIHLGGDEAPKGNWDRCPDCQAVIKKLGLKNSEELQLYFSSEMAKYLKTKGRKAIFWGDLVYHEGPQLPENVVIHWWNYRGRKDLALRNAIKHNYSVICGTNYFTYLNFPVTAWKIYNKKRTFNFKQVYENNPSYCPQEISPLILGSSCALWTDGNVTEAQLDQRIFPRIFAIAEQMWNKNNLIPFEQFYQRVKNQRFWWEKQGYTFGPGMANEVPADYQW